MKKVNLLFVLLFATTIVFAQQNKTEKAGTAERTTIEGKFDGFIIPKMDDIQFLPQLDNKISKNKSVNDAGLRELKIKKMIEKRAALLQEENSNPQEKKRGVANNPVKIADYNAIGNDGTPSDNTIAVNKNGQIIAMVNSSIRYYNTSGGTLASTINLPNFFTNSPTANICDPKVIFDPQANRFICFAQTCDGSPSTSRLLLAFSKTSNPVDGFNLYSYSGNPTGANFNGNNWFDYPKIAVSDNDVFVSGNLFTPIGGGDHDYVTSVVYQINKIKSFAGQTISGSDAIIWSAFSGSPFTIVPIGYGQDGGYGNNMYLCASKAGGSSFIYLYEITNTGANNPVVETWFPTCTPYASPADGIQKGSGFDLQTGDVRGMDGFYLNGEIHFVFHCDGPGNYVGVHYSRYRKNGSNWASTHSKIISIPNVDIAYPSIASMGYTNSDQAALISYTYSSANDYPGLRCIFSNNYFDFSDPVELKTGTGPVTFGPSQGAVRWGDYTGSSRENGQGLPTVWAFGLYGKSGSQNWNNSFIKVQTGDWALSDNTIKTETQKNEVAIYPNPVIEDRFMIDFNLEESGDINISLFDIQGKKLRTIMESKAAKGKNKFSFEKGSLASGTYFVKIFINNKNVKNEKLFISTK